MSIYLDENLSEYVAEALNLLNKGYFENTKVLSTKNSIGRGKPDEEIIPIIGKEGSSLITRDLNIKKTRLQFELCKQYKLGVFFIDLPKGENKHWELVKTIIYHWEAIVYESVHCKKPFAFRVRKNGKMELMK